MLKYLVVLIDDSAVSFCHYPQHEQPKLMTEKVLNECITYAMKENLVAQFVLPADGVPQAYFDMMERVDHIKIAPIGHKYSIGVDVVVVNDFTSLSETDLAFDGLMALRTDIHTLASNIGQAQKLLMRKGRTNIVLLDLYNADDKILGLYKNVLATLAEEAVDKSVQLNILTDRIYLSSMNNCGAGDGTLTVAPDGNLYICPGFYYENEASVGSVADGASIPNQRLYTIQYAPICRNCDAYQCKRCVWLNKKLTFEVNTPGRQQCVAAHFERNAARRLQLASGGNIDTLIPEIDYIDPFDKVKHDY